MDHNELLKLDNTFIGYDRKRGRAISTCLVNNTYIKTYFKMDEEKINSILFLQLASTKKIQKWWRYYWGKQILDAIYETINLPDDIIREVLKYALML